MNLFCVFIMERFNVMQSSLEWQPTVIFYERLSDNVTSPSNFIYSFPVIDFT